MKSIFLIIFVVLISCSPMTPVVPVIESTPTVQPSSEPTFTPTPQLAATVTAHPTIPATITPIPCDPHTVEYCITDGRFILRRPIQPPANASVDPTYRYASTANGTRDPHHGVEIGSDAGTPVHAAADGTVIFAGPDKEAKYSPWPNFYGNVVVIHHMDDLFTLYAHLSKIDVRAGNTVQMGVKIGEVGQTGAATGSHLHFEVRRGEVENYFSTVNPELWLVPSHPEYGAVSLAILNAAGLFQRARLTLEHRSESNEILEEYYLDSYDPRMPMYEENAALGDLPAGRYRIALIQNGYLYERWVEVQSGKLTQIMIVVQ
jgi:hypothetical protein